MTAMTTTLLSPTRAVASFGDSLCFDLDDMAQALVRTRRRGVDFADLYLQRFSHESWTLADGRVREADYGIDAGFAARAVIGEQTGFCSSQQFDREALFAAADSAGQIMRQSRDINATIPARRAVVAPKRLYAQDEHIASNDSDAIVALLKGIDARCRQNAAVRQVTATVSTVHAVAIIMADDGRLACDSRPMVRLSVNVTIQTPSGRFESASAGIGGRTDMTLLTEQAVHNVADEALRLALLLGDAAPAPAGQLPVVLGSGWPGILLHEAVGHGLEADFNRKSLSVFSGKIGEQVASPHCTVIDDACIAGARGALHVDDEGNVGQRTVLIENGVLRAYMQDEHSARLTGMAPTGNGRRQSYAYPPMPRMTNTFMAAGEHTPADIVASLDKGIYAVNFSGGQVDIISGNFVFSMSEAYYVEHGKIVHPVRGATLIGNGPEVMQRISMVGNDLALDPGIGTCGKNGQSVPVCVGQPTLRIDALTIGGTA